MMIPVIAGSVAVKEKLGEGSAAAVYRAVINKSQIVALKVYRMRCESVCASEASLLSAVPHANIVQVLGWIQGAQGGPPSLALEYLNGGSLFSMIYKQMVDVHRPTYTDEQALIWAEQLASALQALHEQPTAIVHRDIKADNVLLANGGPGGPVCKLVDFSLATELHKNKLHTPHTCFSSSSFPDSEIYSPSSTVTTDSSSLASSMSHWLPQQSRNHQTHQPALYPQHGSWEAPTNLHDMGSSEDGSVCAVSSSASWETVPEEDETTSAGQVAALWDQHIFGRMDPRSGVASTSYNLTGETGSYAYMAPEVFSNLPYNEKADVFSYGVLLYELFSRALVIYTAVREGTEEEIQGYARSVSRGYRLPPSKRIPPLVWALIQACWHQEPEQRPRMADVRQNIQSMMGRRVRSPRTRRPLMVGGQLIGGQLRSPTAMCPVAMAVPSLRLKKKETAEKKKSAQKEEGNGGSCSIM